MPININIVITDEIAFDFRKANGLSDAEIEIIAPINFKVLNMQYVDGGSSDLELLLNNVVQTTFPVDFTESDSLKVRVENPSNAVIRLETQKT